MSEPLTFPGVPLPLLGEGDRVRSRDHPDLTGYVKHYEWNKPGRLSPIPYCISWDDSALACELLGWLFAYQSDHGVEAEPAALSPEPVR